MAAFVVVAPTGSSSALRRGARLNIFPGSATPTVFAAGAPFWIGYGFVPEYGEGDQAAIHPETCFELFVDGHAVPLDTELETDHGRTLCKFTVAHFPHGLPPGWHVFAARWYDEGALALAGDTSIEFVER
jgi:hypothetical protein